MVSEILTEQPELLAVEVTRRIRERGYTGGKPAFSTVSINEKRRSQWISVCPEIELVTRMSPERWVIMCGSTAWMQRRTPLTFTSTSRARASRSPVGELSGDVHPGVCKEYVDAAEALARLLDQAGDVSARGDVRGHCECRGPKLLLQGAKLLR